MSEYDTLPPCSFRNGAGRRIVFCRHPDTAHKVTRKDCLSCKLIDSDALPVEATPPQQVRCVHLGDKIHEEPCACGASTKIPIHECSLLPQRCSPDKHSKLPVDVRGAIRNCRNCVSRSTSHDKQPVDVLYFRHSSTTNQDVNASLKLLSEDGITAHTVNVGSSTDIVAAINMHKPKVVINRGGCVKLEAIEQLSQQLPHITFVNGCHSTLSHLFLNRGLLTTWSRFWKLAETRKNVWISSPDHRHPFECERSIWIPNPISLPDYSEPEMHDPVTISLVGRRDFVKNFPNQIAALAIVANQHRIRVAMCIRGDSSELEQLAHDRGLQLTSRQWSQPESFRQWIASDIDIGLCCSYSETFCYAALDHMVSGKPVIGGVGMDVIDEDLRSDQDSPHDIAQRLDNAISNYDHFSHRSRCQAEEIAATNNAEFVRAIRDLVRIQ